MSKETVGEFLKKERELRQITIQEVAEGTKISISRLRLIEENRFDDLPAEVFVRGFIRNYADYIGIDPEEAILRLEEDLGGQSNMSSRQPEMVATTSIDVGSRDSKRFLGIVIGTILVFLVAAGIYYFFFYGKGQLRLFSYGVNSSVTTDTKDAESKNTEGVSFEKGETGPKILLEEETNSSNITNTVPSKP